MNLKLTSLLIIALSVSSTLQQGKRCENLAEEPKYLGIIPRCCMQKNFLPSLEMNCVKFVRAPY